MQKYWCNFLASSLKLILHLLDMTQLYIYLNMGRKASHSSHFHWHPSVCQNTSCCTWSKVQKEQASSLAVQLCRIQKISLSVSKHSSKVIVNQTTFTVLLSTLHLFAVCTLFWLAFWERVWNSKHWHCWISPLEALCTVMVSECIY